MIFLGFSMLVWCFDVVSFGLKVFLGSFFSNTNPSKMMKRACCILPTCMHLPFIPVTLLCLTSSLLYLSYIYQWAPKTMNTHRCSSPQKNMFLKQKPWFFSFSLGFFGVLGIFSYVNPLLIQCLPRAQGDRLLDPEGKVPGIAGQRHQVSGSVDEKTRKEVRRLMQQRRPETCLKCFFFFFLGGGVVLKICSNVVVF